MKKLKEFFLSYWPILLVVVVYVIISATRGQWNPIDWFKDKLPPPPTPGTGCITADGKSGIYDANGTCIKSAPAGGGPTTTERIIIATAPNSLLVRTTVGTPFGKYGCTYGNPMPYRYGWKRVFKISCP